MPKRFKVGDLVDGTLKANKTKGIGTVVEVVGEGKGQNFEIKWPNNTFESCTNRGIITHASEALFPQNIVIEPAQHIDHEQTAEDSPDSSHSSDSEVEQILLDSWHN